MVKGEEAERTIIIVLELQAARGGINVETERNAAQTISEVTLATITLDDVGKYTCRPSEGRTDSIVLIVQPGERAFFFFQRLIFHQKGHILLYPKTRSS